MIITCFRVMNNKNHQLSIILNIMVDDARDLFDIEVDEFQKKAKVTILRRAEGAAQSFLAKSRSLRLWHRA